MTCLFYSTLLIDMFSQPTIFFIIIIFVGVIIFFINFYNTKNTILRELKKGKRKAIRHAKENEYIKIIGKAKYVNEPLIAPLSGRKCVYYHVLVERKGDKSWHNLIDETISQDFFIETKGEMALIKPNQPKNFKKIYLVKDHTKNSGFLNDATERLELYLKKHDETSTNFIGLNKTIRYREGIIELNENIAIKGIANWKSIKEPIEGYLHSKILLLKGSAGKKLIITDLPKALDLVKTNRE